MGRTQWITAGVVFLISIGLFAVTQNKIFGYHPKTATASTGTNNEHEGHDHAELSIDTILHHAKQNLTAEKVSRLNLLESSITRGDVSSQKIHLYHQLARFWRDTARIFEPYAWYSGEAARLENSENSLTFAAHLFLNNLRSEANQELKHWKALQSKDLFERSLKLNPNNDSIKVSLGTTYLLGGISDNPMEGILMIRKVIEKDSNNVYAQLTLGEASLISGQLDKAAERFKKVIIIDSVNLQATLSLADLYERQKQNQNAIVWYRKSLPLIKIPELSREVEKRINELNKTN
jgi:Tfp pilus assembly protein PilF